MSEDKNYNILPMEDELEIDLMKYIRQLWGARKLFLKVASIAAIVGIIIAFSVPKTYTAEVILTPEAGKGGGSNVSGMAAMLGLGNVTMGGEANAVNISMASEIIASTPFILELFDVQVRTLDEKMDTTLVAYLATEKRPWWNTVMSLPNQAIHGIKKLFSGSSVATEEKPIDLFRLTPRQRGQANAIKNVITAETDRRSGMTKISVTLQDPLVAATLVDTVLVQLQKYITKYKTSKAEENCRYWKQLYDERQSEYYQAQEAYAAYADANQGVILQSVRIEQERLQNEVNLAFQVFNQVATQLQLSRAKLQEAKPAFTIMEPASVPLYSQGANTKLILVGCVFLAVAVVAAWVLFGKDLWKSLKEGLNEQESSKKEKV